MALGAGIQVLRGPNAAPGAKFTLSERLGSGRRQTVKGPGHTRIPFLPPSPGISLCISDHCHTPLPPAGATVSFRSLMAHSQGPQSALPTAPDKYCVLPTHCHALRGALPTLPLHEILLGYHRACTSKHCKK